METPRKSVTGFRHLPGYLFTLAKSPTTMPAREKHPREWLDKRYAKIVKAIYREGGAANTTKIKAATGIDTNQIITQRLDRLEEWGIVQTGYQPVSESGNRLPTKTGTLTSYGRQIVEEGTVDRFLDDDRVEGVYELNKRVDEIDRQVAAQQDDLNKLLNRVESIEEFLKQAGYNS